MSEPLPLDGVRVVEFCHTIMGPSCGLVLADLGAEVIKVEAAPAGDHTRKLYGFASGFFTTFNRNKRSVAIDMKSPEGKAVVERLVASADVLLENYGPGTMDRLGFGWDAVRKINPRLVYCSLKGFLSGPYEHRPALDEVVQYMSGLAYMTGLPGRPLRAGTSIVDIMGGVFGVVAILAALRERDRTGKGEFVKSALFESAAFLVAQHMAAETITGMAPPPMSMRHAAWGVYDMFEAKDGTPLFVGVTSNNHWTSFCKALGRPELLEDPELQTNEARVAARARLTPIVAELIAQHDAAELFEIFERERIPFSPVAVPGDLFDDPQLAAHGGLLETETPSGGATQIPALPIELGEHELGLRGQPPKLGADTAEVLREIGYAPEEIEKLRAAGVIVAAPSKAAAV